MSNLIVYKDNEVTEASYKLSLIEQRIILFCIAKVNPLDKENYEKQKEQTIYVDEFAKMFLDFDRNSVYKQLKEAINKLYERSIIVKKPRSVKTFRWISSKHYFENEAQAIIRFSDEVMPYLAKLKNQFTKYELHNVSAFKRVYSIRLYELLTQYKTKKARNLSVLELRTALQLNDKFKLFAEFKRKVIDSSIEEINEKSDLMIKYSLVKRGRSVVSIDFKITEKSRIKQIQPLKQTNELNSERKGLKSANELALNTQKYLDQIKKQLEN